MGEVVGSSYQLALEVVSKSDDMLLNNLKFPKDSSKLYVLKAILSVLNSTTVGIDNEEISKNDDNSSYTMADAVFTACFLNAMNRHCDIVGMANFAPILNTRGCIYSYKDGVVLRSTYHVFDLYVNHMGDTVLDSWEEGEKNTFTVLDKNGRKVTVNTLDILATQHSETEKISIAVVNKEPDKEKKLEILKDSHNGAFAVIGICCYFTVSLGVWSEIRTEMLPVVAAGYVISRALSGIAVVTFPAASATLTGRWARSVSVMVVLPRPSVFFRIVPVVV